VERKWWSILRGPRKLGVIMDWEPRVCANELMRRHGEDAVFHAAMRADELIAAGDVEGQRAWLRIIECIEQLERAPKEPLN
jgi:hypothetical protein